MDVENWHGKLPYLTEYEFCEKARRKRRENGTTFKYNVGWFYRLQTMRSISLRIFFFDIGTFCLLSCSLHIFSRWRRCTLRWQKKKDVYFTKEGRKKLHYENSTKLNHDVFEKLPRYCFFPSLLSLETTRRPYHILVAYLSHHCLWYS